MSFAGAGDWVLFLAVCSRSLDPKSREAVQSNTHCKLRDFYQDLVFRPVNQEIRRLQKKDQFLGCAPSQRDEGAAENS